MEDTIEDKGDRPYPQSRSGMSDNRWHALLDRWLAGEPIGDLARAYGVRPTSIHRNARKFGKRKKDHPKAVWQPKGPAVVTAQHQADGTVRLVCRTLAVSIDLRDPLAVREAALDTLSWAAGTGYWRESKGFTCLTKGALDLLDPRWRRTRLRWIPPEPVEGDAEAEPDEPGPPIELRKAQRPPEGDWATWLFLGGRGAGKTLAGASWLAGQATAAGGDGRLALIGPTLHDVREVMVEGVSGIRTLPRWTRATRPRFEPSRRRLLFDNGAVAQAFSAEDPDSLRGPQFSAAWADEFCAWPAVGARGAGETLALLRMGLRLGPRPRLVVTTTPRATRALLALKAEPTCEASHATTLENAAFLSPRFLDDLLTLYGGTRRAAQELEGQVVELEGALFTAAMMAGAREEWRVVSGEWRGGGGGAASGAIVEVGPPDANDPNHSPRATHRSPLPLDRIVVAIDPTTTAGGDACGIVAAGSRRRADGRREAVVLADRSAAGLSPDGWARRAAALADEVGAACIVAEVNQGGAMVKAVLRTAGCAVRVKEVRAMRGKRIRAEPVAALYEQGRVHHAGAFAALEEELMAFGTEGEAAGSLDRADALVWAITDLLIDRPEGETGPRLRWL
jgi:phage terminase large subunit-like protein